jgi:hypothetical protein
MSLGSAEMMHEKVKPGQRRPTIALLAFRSEAKVSGHHQCCHSWYSMNSLGTSIAVPEARKQAEISENDDQ